MSVHLETSTREFSVFDLEDRRLEEWMKTASEMQKVHCLDNNNTESFQYADTERDVIQLRVCQILFGLKLSESNENALPRGTPSSMLKRYSWTERRRAKQFQVQIMQYGKTDEGNIKMNVVFVSVALKKTDSNYHASEIPVIVLGDGDGKRYLDTTGRYYENWEKYLTENKIPQGLMIYPKDGHYTPEGDDVVILNMRETPSCKLSAQAMEDLDKIATISSLVLIGSMVATMVPMAIFSATTMAALSTGSFYLGTALTVHSLISTTCELYDKVTHGQSARTEILILATMAFSRFSQWYTKQLTNTLASSVAKKELWSEVSKGFTRTQKVLFLTHKLIQIGLSASSVLSALWDLWMKKDRSWSDWRNLAVSCFFFANVIVKPITLQALFESEQGKYIQQQFGSKVTTSEAKEEYDKTVKNAKTTEQKTYLTRNLEKIEDINEHFYQVHETGTVVDYTENGMVINNAPAITPEAYNQTLNSSYQRRQNEIKLLPTLPVSSRYFMENSETIFKKFNEFLDDTNKIIRNPQEFLKSIGKILNSSKIIAKLVGTVFIHANLGEISGIVQRIISNAEVILEFFHGVMNHVDVILNTVRNNLNYEVILLILGLIVTHRQSIFNIFGSVRQNPTKISSVINEINSTSFPEDPATFWETVENVFRRIMSFFGRNEREFSSEVSTDRPNQFLITRIPIQTVETEIEQAFRVRNYREAQVGGQRIFNTLTINDASRLYQLIYTFPANPVLRRKYFEITCQLINDPECRSQAESPSQFANILKIVQRCVNNRQTIEDLPQNQVQDEELFLNAILANNGPAYPAIRIQLNLIYDDHRDDAVSTISREHQHEFLTTEADVSHSLNAEHFLEDPYGTDLFRTFGTTLTRPGIRNDSGDTQENSGTLNSNSGSAETTNGINLETGREWLNL